MKTTAGIAFIVLSLPIAFPAAGGELAGVVLPDRVQVDGATLVATRVSSGDSAKSV